MSSEVANPGAVPESASALLKLHLGCGAKRLAGFVNVDCEAACHPDVVCNLERAPWPWSESSVDEVHMIHVLEHLGRTPDSYLTVIKELWRVCMDGARIHIVVPHHRHDNFFSDPTHVRPITPLGLSLFNKVLCREWQAGGYSNTPLALYCGVDFEIEHLHYDVEDAWMERIRSGELSAERVLEQAGTSCNIITQIQVVWRVHKSR